MCSKLHPVQLQNGCNDRRGPVEWRSAAPPAPASTPAQPYKTANRPDAARQPRQPARRRPAQTPRSDRARRGRARRARPPPPTGHLPRLAKAAGVSVDFLYRSPLRARIEELRATAQITTPAVNVEQAAASDSQVVRALAAQVANSRAATTKRPPNSNRTRGRPRREPRAAREARPPHPRTLRSNASTRRRSTAGRAAPSTGPQPSQPRPCQAGSTTTTSPDHTAAWPRRRPARG